MYEDNTVYSKYMGSSSTSEGCDGGCNGNSSVNNCDCCPPGLVKAIAADGTVVGCVTPADAAQYASDTLKCTDGYIENMSEVREGI